MGINALSECNNNQAQFTNAINIPNPNTLEASILWVKNFAHFNKHFVCIYKYKINFAIKEIEYDIKSVQGSVIYKTIYCQI